MSLKFRQLQALHSIIELGTTTAAAEALGISQPAISNLIATLESQSKLVLFDRKRGRLIPTPEARVLYQEIDTVIRGLDNVQQTVDDLQNKQAGQLLVASQHSTSHGFLPKLISEFARDRPDVQITFQTQYSPKIQEWIHSGVFEIGICELPLVQHDLDYTPIFVETRLAMPVDHPLAQYDLITPELLDGVPFIVTGHDHMTHRRLREALQRAAVNLNVRVHSHLFMNLLSFVKNGLGVAILDNFVIDHDFEGGFVTRPFRPKITLDLAIITAKNRPLSTLGQEFLTLLTDRLTSFDTGPSDNS